MPDPPRDDRLGDLGHKSAAERFEELDEREPEQPPKPPQRARPSSVYSWVVGIVFLIVAALVALNTIPNSGEGYRGPPVGRLLPVFASPNALGPLSGDSNIKQSRQQQIGNKTAACDVKGRGVVSPCEARGKRPIVLTLTTLGCGPELKEVQRVASEFPDVEFIGVVSGKPKKEVAKAVVKDRITYPVAVDSDNALFNLYQVGVCPSTVLVGSDGKVRKTVIDKMSDAELRQEVSRLR